MSWWKKMIKETIGTSEVREHENYEDVKFSTYDESAYDKDEEDIEPLEEDFLASDEIEEEEIVPEYKDVKPLDLMKVNFERSPNQSNRKGEVEYIVLHHTGPGSFNGIVNWLCNKDAKASAHYVLGTGGQLKQLVNTGKEAWHAGIAYWEGKKINNHLSIGIEICNIGIMSKGSDDKFYYSVGRSVKKYTGSVEPEEGYIVFPSGSELGGYFVPYPEKQIDKLIALCKGLVEKYPAITKDNILTHYDIALPEGRKNDPFALDIEIIKDRIFG